MAQFESSPARPSDRLGGSFPTPESQFFDHVFPRRRPWFGRFSLTGGQEAEAVAQLADSPTAEAEIARHQPHQKFSRRHDARGRREIPAHGRDADERGGNGQDRPREKENAENRPPQSLGLAGIFHAHEQPHPGQSEEIADEPEKFNKHAPREGKSSPEPQLAPAENEQPSVHRDHEQERPEQLAFDGGGGAEQNGVAIQRSCQQYLKLAALPP